MDTFFLIFIVILGIGLYCIAEIGLMFLIDELKVFKLDIEKYNLQSIKSDFSLWE